MKSPTEYFQLPHALLLSGYSSQYGIQTYHNNIDIHLLKMFHAQILLSVINQKVAENVDLIYLTEFEVDMNHPDPANQLFLFSV